MCVYRAPVLITVGIYSSGGGRAWERSVRYRVKNHEKSMKNIGKSSHAHVTVDGTCGMILRGAGFSFTFLFGRFLTVSRMIFRNF